MTLENGYRTDLAYVHDAGYGGIARDAANRLVGELAASEIREGTVVDLGCGSGILAQPIIDAGYSVMGVDTSEAMVTLARQRAPRATFHVTSFVSATLPTCVAVTAIGEVLNYGFDPANSESSRASLFERVYDALVPGGLWLFDVAGPERARAASHRSTARGQDWRVVVETTFDPSTNVLTRRIQSVRHVGVEETRDIETHRLVLVDPAALIAALDLVGFETQLIEVYRTQRLPPGVQAFLCRKPVKSA